jgi:hypothetical protein
MSYSSANGGAAILHQDETGVYVTQGCQIGAIPSRKVLNARFRLAGVTYTVVGVYAVHVSEGHVFFTVVGHTVDGFQSFKFCNNPYCDHSGLVSNAAGEIYTTGLIPLLDYGASPAKIIAPASIIYDEQSDRLFYEAASTDGPSVGQVNISWKAIGAAGMLSYVVPNGVAITDVMYAYGGDGAATIVFGAYNGATGNTSIYDATGRPSLVVAGKPVSRYGLISNVTAGDMFDIILFASNGVLRAVNIDANVPGDIQAMWVTSVGDGNSKLHLIAEDGQTTLLTTMHLVQPATRVYVYTDADRIVYDARTGDILSTSSPPVRKPVSAIATPEGHATVARATNGSDIVYYGRYIQDELVAEYPTADTTTTLTLNGTERLTRLDSILSFAGRAIAMDFSVEYEGVGDPSFIHFAQRGNYNLSYTAERQLVASTPGGGLLQFQDIVGRSRPVQVMMDDDTFGGFTWEEVTAGSAPYRISFAQFIIGSGSSPSAWDVKDLVASTAARPSFCDRFKYDGEEFIVSVGNWLTGENEEVVIYHAADWHTSTPTLNPVAIFQLDPAFRMVQSLRAEGDTVVFTGEPHPAGSVGTSMATKGPTFNTDSTSVSYLLEAPVAPDAYTDLVVDKIMLLTQYGRYQVYIKIDNVPGSVNAPIDVTVGVSSATIPMNESRVFHVMEVDALWTDQVGGVTTPNHVRIMADLGPIAFIVPGLTAGSTLASALLTGGTNLYQGVVIDTGSVMGITDPAAAKISIYNIASEELTIIDRPTVGVNAIAVSVPSLQTLVETVVYN